MFREQNATNEQRTKAYDYSFEKVSAKFDGLGIMCWKYGSRLLKYNNLYHCKLP